MVTAQGFLLDEDTALKAKLNTGISVSRNEGDTTTVPIAVYFRFPDVEVRDRTFPHIAIDLTEVVFAADRAHRADLWQVPVPPVGSVPATPGDIAMAQDYPLPWQLMYQLAVYSRQPFHDRLIHGYMLQLFPQQFGFLDMTNIDGTIRRADLISVIRRDTRDRENKRLYRNVFTVSVSAEFFLRQIQYLQEATSVVVTYETMQGQVIS